LPFCASSIPFLDNAKHYKVFTSKPD